MFVRFQFTGTGIEFETFAPEECCWNIVAKDGKTFSAAFAKKTFCNSQ